jgi:hypothetical protein
MAARATRGRQSLISPAHFARTQLLPLNPNPIPPQTTEHPQAASKPVINWTDLTNCGGRWSEPMTNPAKSALPAR